MLSLVFSDPSSGKKVLVFGCTLRSARLAGAACTCSRITVSCRDLSKVEKDLRVANAIIKSISILVRIFSEAIESPIFVVVVVVIGVVVGCGRRTTKGSILFSKMRLVVVWEKMCAGSRSKSAIWLFSLSR